MFSNVGKKKHLSKQQLMILLVISGYGVFAVFLILIDFLLSKYTHYWGVTLLFKRLC